MSVVGAQGPRKIIIKIDTYYYLLFYINIYIA